MKVGDKVKFQGGKNNRQMRVVDIDGREIIVMDDMGNAYVLWDSDVEMYEEETS